MNRREKILALIVVVGMCAYVGYQVSAKFLLNPKAKLEAEAKDLRTKILDLKAENGLERIYLSRLRKTAGRTFGGDEEAVREQMRVRLIRLLEDGGLSTDKLISQPLQGKRLKHKDKARDRSIGRSVTIRGKPSHIINFLYLLKKDPHVHRVESVSLSPDTKTGRMNLQLKYFTLIMGPVRGRKPASSPATNPAGTLDAPDRDRYDVIVHRDVFRPYMPRKKTVVVRPKEGPIRNIRRPTPKPDPAKPAPSVVKGRLRVAGLAMLFGVPEVNVEDKSSGEIKTYKIGETLGSGTIVMIDYRPLPKQESPKDESASRVILRIGGAYWAVEIGKHLVDKHRLKASQLPPELRGRIGVEKDPTAEGEKT